MNRDFLTAAGLVTAICGTSAWAGIDNILDQPGGDGGAQPGRLGQEAGCMFPDRDPDYMIIALTDNGYGDDQPFPDGYYMKYATFNCDGARIAVSARNQVGGVSQPYEIWIMDYDAGTQTVSNFQQLTDNGGVGDVVGNFMCSWSRKNPDLLMFLEGHQTEANPIRTYDVGTDTFTTVYDPAQDSNGYDCTNPAFYGFNDDMFVFGSGYGTDNDRILLFKGDYPSTQISGDDQNLDPASNYAGTRVSYYSTQSTYPHPAGSIYTELAACDWTENLDGWGDPGDGNVPGLWAFYSGKPDNRIFSLRSDLGWSANGLGLYAADGVLISDLLGDAGTDFQWAYANHNWQGPNGEILFRAEEYTHSGFGNNMFIARKIAATNIDTWTQFTSIQDAIDAAGVGETVSIAQGAFEEQIVIDKAITLVGHGAGNTIIQSPVTLTEFFSTSKDNYPVVYVHDTEGVTIRDLTVDGMGRGNANYRFVGVGFWNAGGSIIDCDIINIQDTPFSGVQHCIGIYTYNDTSGPYTLDVVRTDLVDYQKNGMALSGEGLTVNVVDCTTTGKGPTDVTAQNGIQIGYGATGVVDGCTVTGHVWTGDTWTASGMLLDTSSSIVVRDSVVNNNQTGVYCYAINGLFDGLSVSNLTADTWDGFYATNESDVLGPLDAGPRLASSPFGESLSQHPGPRGDIEVTVTNSRFVGHNEADSWGVGAYSFGADAVYLSLQNCLVQDWDYGVYSYAHVGPVYADVQSCSFDGNTSYGFYSSVFDPPIVQGGRYNWWGRDSGPFHATGNPGGAGDAVSDGVAFSPWAHDSANLSLVTSVSGWCDIGTEVSVYIDMDGATETVNSGGFFLAYDDTKLEFIEALPGPDPFDQEYFESNPHVPGLLDYASGVDFGESGATSGRMAEIRFRTLAEVCSVSSLVTFRENTPPTLLTGDGTFSIACVADPLPSQTVDETSPMVVAPDDVAVQCSEDVPSPVVTMAQFLMLTGAGAWDNCTPQSNLTVAWIEDDPGGACPETITRTYRITDACGNYADCAYDIVVDDTTPPEIHAMPEDITVLSDAGGCTAVVTWDEPYATDNCDCGIDSFSSNYPSGHAFPAGQTTEVIYTAVDCCGNETTCSFYVTVEDKVQLVLDLQLQSVNVAELTRCITFEYFLDANTRTTVEEEITFYGGLASGVVLEIPCGDWQCMTARDTLHTLRRTLDLGAGFNNLVTYYEADFVTTSKLLIGGNLNDMYDPWIDILDFGIYVSEYGTSYPDGDTLCGVYSRHADIDGDGLIGTQDFTFIQINYLSEHEDDCWGGWPAPVGGQAPDLTSAGPVTRISVNELVRRGMSDLVVADLNCDGWLDENDIALFINGVRPDSRRR